MVALHPSSALDHKPDFVVYHEVVLTSKNYIRTVSDVKPEWLFEVAPAYFNPVKVKDMDTRRSLEKVERDLIERKKYTDGKNGDKAKKKGF